MAENKKEEQNIGQQFIDRFVEQLPTNIMYPSLPLQLYRKHQKIQHAEEIESLKQKSREARDLRLQEIRKRRGPQRDPAQAIDVLAEDDAQMFGTQTAQPGVDISQASKAIESSGDEELDALMAEAETLIPGTGGGKQLSQQFVSDYNQVAAILNGLDDLEKEIEANINGPSPVFAPEHDMRYDFPAAIAGHIKEYLGQKKVNAQAQIIDSKIMQWRQPWGKWMEGGVLREADEIKYARMGPSLSDSPRVVRAKIRGIRTAILNRIAADQEALGRSGFYIGGIYKPISDEELAGEPGVYDIPGPSGVDPRRRLQRMIEETRKNIKEGKATEKDVEVLLENLRQLKSQ